MLPVYVELILLTGAILFIGSLLVRYAESLSEITGIGQIFIGSIVLAGATSLPELAVDAHAVLKGMPNLAVGDLFGSCLFNLLILAVADLIHKERGAMFGPAAARHALSGVLSIAMVSIVAMMVLLSKFDRHLTIGGLGSGPIIVGIVYIFGSRIIYRDALRSGQIKTSINLKLNMSHPLWGVLIKYALCTIALLIVAPELARVADQIATNSNLGRTFIGTTLVAGITSMPEMVATIIAVRRGSFGLAAGNIFGSNAFNMVILLPLDALFPGDLLGKVDFSHMITCLSVVFITSIAVSAQLYQVAQRRRFIDPDAWVVIGLVITALFLLYLTHDFAGVF
ncbi:MAG: hypothetical protein FJ146_06035 [Deltaproteobacteria bacterium]|nr:hypothetical protein [Deltaproteobacteria bacterium]